MYTSFFIQACDAWKKEATEAAEKAKLAEKDKQTAIQSKDEVGVFYKKNYIA